MKQDRHKNKGILVRLPDELKERLSSVAKKHSTSMTAIIHKGTENRVDELERKDPV